MFKLEKGNVVRIVETEQEKEKLVREGFVEVVEAKEDSVVTKENKTKAR